MDEVPLVLVDARMARRRSGGVATYVRELRAAMEADPPKDLRIRWLSGPPGLPRLNRLTTVGNLVLDLVWIHIAVPLIAWRSKAALIHATFNWAPWWSPCPTVVTVHDLAWERRPQDFPPSFRRYARLFTRRSARRASVVLTPSASAAEDVSALYGVPRGRTRPIPHGVRSNEEPAARREPFILAVGELHPRKRIVELVQGHALYLADAPPEPAPCRLVVVGGPAGAEHDVAAAAGPGCELRGFVPRDELLDLYRRARLLVFPSAHEGFGMPVAEAMASGCPVLVARNSSLTEVAGEHGLPIDDPTPEGIAQALRAALSDEAALAERGERSRRDALARFSWSAAAREILAAYRVALAGR